jgi:tetratricopeptide (TPR) repeat protein
MELGLYEDALKDLDIALQINPRDVGVLYLRGEIYAVMGQTDKAISDIENSLDMGLPPDLQQTAEALLRELKKP